MKTNNLKKEYSKIFSKGENRPDWTVKKKSNPKEIIHPSIPFVGKNYDNTKILLYASAENLTYYTEQNDNIDYLDNDKIAIDRHRYCYENYSNDRFFPHVHIEPVNNGALILIVAYITKVLKQKEFANPYELVENIAIANFCKFSIQPKKSSKTKKEKNIDCAENYSFLSYSIKYVETDLKILEPDIIIIPKTIFDHKPIREMIFNQIPNTIVIPIMQVNTTTINTKIHTKYREKNKTELENWLVDWHEKLPISGAIKGKIKDNYYSVYTYLDEILKK